MNTLGTHAANVRAQMKALSTEARAERNRYYFPDGAICTGVSAGDIKQIIGNFQSEHPGIDAEEMLALTEHLLATAYYHEEKLIAFGLINKFVKKNYEDSLMLRFEYWLEHYANNWAQVDDLCMKTIYQFFMSRPHLIETAQRWSHSDVSWCRRASNVAWVKFINRKMGKAVYRLDPSLVFQNCDLLLKDDDEFVQKSVGWLLKATSLYHERDVILYLEKNYEDMTRHTLRYAIEKMAPDTRKYILAKTK
jgi:3-methyladenine DNA glycosylase AlkD